MKIVAGVAEAGAAEAEAGTAEGEERDEGSSLGEAVDDPPSWVQGGFESAEAEQEYWDRQKREKPLREEKQRWVAKQWADALAGKRVVDCKRLAAEAAHWRQLGI